MIEEEIRMHLAAGRYYGRLATCGKKQRHDSEEKANRHACHLNDRKTFSPETEPHTVEAYPCFWCSDSFLDSAGVREIDYTHMYWHVGRTMTEPERKMFSSAAGQKILDMEVVKIATTDPTFGIYEGINNLRVHNRKYCEGEFCTIHNPSDHRMKDWPMVWRGDRGIMERTCSHGIGHPDPDDSDFRKRRDGDNGNYDSGIHGCCGCCATQTKEDNA